MGNYPFYEYLVMSGSTRVGGIGEAIIEHDSPIPTGDLVEAYVFVNSSTGYIYYTVYDETANRSWSESSPIIDRSTGLSFWDPSTGEFIDERNTLSNGQLANLY